MEFKRLPRSCTIEGGWRLATVEEAQQNIDSVNLLLEKWDRVRLLDGWIGGSAYEFHAEMSFRSCVGYMLLVKSSPPATGDSVKYRYSGVTLSDKGKRAALFLCTEDWNYEVVGWLLESWSRAKTDHVKSWGLEKANELLEPSKEVSALARELQTMCLREKQSRRPFSLTNMRDLMSKIVSFLKYKTNDSYLTKVLSEINPTLYADMYWRQISWTNDPGRLQEIGFDTSADNTREAIVDTVWHVAVDAMAVGIARGSVIQKHLASANDIFASANRLLDKTFFTDDGLGRIVREAADTAKGDVESFKVILRDQGYGTFSSNGRYSYLNTMLVEATKLGNKNLVGKLLTCGVNPLETDDTQRKTALHHAAMLQYDEDNGCNMADLLLRETTGEMLVNAPDFEHRTPLHSAAVCGHAKMCKLLIKSNATVSAKDNNGQIPLHCALSCDKPNQEVIEVLIKNKSSVDAEDNDGKTPLDYALRYEEDTVKVVEWLLPGFLQSEADIKKLDLASYLRETSRRGHMVLVKMLLDKRADPFEKDKNGKTAVHYAAEGIDDQQALDIIHELVLDKYRQVNKMELSTCDRHGRNVLHIAASAGHRKLCEWLLSLDDILLDTKDRDGRTAVYYAVGGNLDNPKLLDLWGRTPMNIYDLSKQTTLSDLRKQTPLHVAAAKGHAEIVKKILLQLKSKRDRKTVVCAADVFGQTALHKAASGGHEQVAGILLNEGADPLKERDCDGKTALHCAVQAGDNALAMAVLLLDSCNPKEKKFHLLCASAVATGFAEESAGVNSELQKYLEDERHKIAGEGRENLIKAAAKFGNAEVAKELLRRGFNINDIRSDTWRKSLEDEEQKQNVQKVLAEIDSIRKIAGQCTDKPALRDDLGRSTFVNGLASLFLNPFVESPITVGISGEWGMGKSSVMLQMESLLLKVAAQSAFTSSLRKEDSPRTSNSRSAESEKSNDKLVKFVKDLFYKVKFLVKGLYGARENTIKKSNAKELRDILRTYDPEHHKVFKSLAVAERREMIQAKEESKGDDRRQGIIPSILTVQYNAWQYRTHIEAWAGLGVEIIQELEEAMTVAQILSCSWRYNWANRKRSIFVEAILPCFLAVTIAIWVTVILWFVLDRAKNRDLKDFKYGSLPLTLIAVVWGAVNSVMSVVKPISSQVADYLSLPDHSQKLGYHQRVIDDINFLKDELGHKPSRLCRFLAWIWCMTPFCSWKYHISKTRIPKMTPASKDNLRMIVFVDDLDRCEDDVILEILSAINLVLSVCEINVVMAMDKSMIERAIRRSLGTIENESDKYGQERADKYLRKIIQLPLDLPDPSNSHSQCFLQGQLGMLPTQKAAVDREEEKETHSSHGQRKMYSMVRTDTLVPMKSGLGEGDQTRSSLGESRDGERRDHNSGQHTGIMRGRRTDGEEGKDPELGISGGTHDGEPPKQVTGYSFLNSEDNQRSTTFIQKLISFLLCKPQESTANDQEWTEIFPVTIEFELLKPKYTSGESDAFCFLYTQVTGSRKLPREWKRLLNYHRLAWNILCKFREVKTMEGWQVQLIAWVFICWQWKDQINTIIEGWHKLIHVFGRDVPSLKDIVEHHIEEKWPAQNTSTSRFEEVEDTSSRSTWKEEEPDITVSEDYLKEAIRKVMKETRKQERRFFLKVKVLEDWRSHKGKGEHKEQDDSLSVKNNESKKGKSEEVEGGKDSAEQMRINDEDEEEQKKWRNLNETLKRYDVGMTSILTFQIFRFYCVPRYLDWPMPFT